MVVLAAQAGNPASLASRKRSRPSTAQEGASAPDLIGGAIARTEQEKTRLLRVAHVSVVAAVLRQGDS